MKEEILRIEKVSKSIEGINYLDNINFHIFKGEIMGFIPLNNHGKDMLIKLISQNIPVDFGRIYFDDELVNYYEFSKVRNNKVYIIDKEIKLVEGLNVIDNIHVLNENFEGYVINQNIIKEKVDKLIDELGLSIQTNQLIYQLSIFEKTIIELIKAVTNGSKLIVLNEISNFLSVDELSRFHKLIEHYAGKGISFLYMGNHHEEAFQICHRLCLFENGKVIKLIDKIDFSDEVMKPYIISFDLGIKTRGNSANASLRMEDFTTENLKGVNLAVNKGECITILDINNKGIQDIFQIIMGEIKPKMGKLLVDDRVINKLNPYNLILNKVAFIPENPVEGALFYRRTYMENLTFLIDYKLGKSLISKKILKNIREEYKNLLGDDIDEVDIRKLSKKSLYYLVYYRILLFNPRVVFIMQPFSNADMYLRSEIIKLINKLKESGIGIIILAVSISDTSFISDKLYVMEDGKINNQRFSP